MKLEATGGLSILMLAIGAIALVAGVLVNSITPLWLIAIVGGLVTFIYILVDYRIGVVILTLMLPWSYAEFLPRTAGFNLINLFLLASLVGFIAKSMGNKKSALPVPRVVWWYYLLPIFFATLLALPHLSEGARNIPSLARDHFFDYGEYVVGRVVKPLFFMIYSFLLANAIAASKRPERFIIALGISAVIPAFAIMQAVFLQGEDVMLRGSFLQGLGLHPNEYGILLSMAAGPLLFITVGSAQRWAKVASGMALLIVTIGLIFTGTRGAALAYIVAFGVLFARRKKPSDLLILVGVLLVIFLVTPENIIDRFGLGLTPGTQSADAGDDALTKGRFDTWTMLMPDLLDSPLWGKGLGATAWSSPVANGYYRSLHPHNLYLEILLDMGLIGLACMMYVFTVYALRFRRISTDPSISPVLRDYFTGAYASFLGMLVMGLTNLHYMPYPEQTYLWFSLGFLFCYWKLGDKKVDQDSLPAKMKQLNAWRGIVASKPLRKG